MKKHTYAQASMSAMIISLMDSMREVTGDPQVPAQLVVCLFHVAAQRNYNWSISDLADLMGMSPSSASRMVTLLGSGTDEAKGLMLVTTTEDRYNRSIKRVALTAKGRALLRTLEASLLPCVDDWLETKAEYAFKPNSPKTRPSLWLRFWIGLQQKLDRTTQSLGLALGKLAREGHRS